MTASLPDIDLTEQWQDIHLLSGADAGSGVGFQNKSTFAEALIQMKPTVPAASDVDGFPVPPYPHANSFVQIEADAVNKTWVRLIKGTGAAAVVV